MDSGSFAYQLGLSKQPARRLTEKGADAPKMIIAKNDATESANVDAARKLVDAWNKRDAAAFDAGIADDMVYHDMTAPKDMNKKQESESNKSFWKAFTDSKLTLTSIWGAGDYIAMVGTFEGTNDGDFPAMQLKKTGKKVAVPFMEIDRLEGGKFKEAWVFFDGGMFAAQLNLMPGKGQITRDNRERGKQNVHRKVIVESFVEIHADFRGKVPTD